MLSQVGGDTRSIISDLSSAKDTMIIKFNIHKQIKERLEIDLNNRVTHKPKKGINTYFFGDNRQGKCGVGISDPYVIKPQGIFTNLKVITSGHHHNLGIDSNGVLYSWGRNRFGQLG
jgi:alpha-tubulin suppressor-like RCC1 family protein